jgi:hypothetical protein
MRIKSSILTAKAAVPHLRDSQSTQSIDNLWFVKTIQERNPACAGLARLLASQTRFHQSVGIRRDAALAALCALNTFISLKNKTLRSLRKPLRTLRLDFSTLDWHE